MTTITVRGFAVGDNTSCPIADGSLQLSGVVARQAPVPLIGGGVGFAGTDVGEAGSLAFEAHVLGDSVDDCLDLVDALSAAWAPGDDLELLFAMGGRSRVYRGRSLSCVPVLDGTPTGAARCSFTVFDPLWYAATPSSATVTAGGTSGGFVSPFVSPFVSTGSGSPGDAAVFNSGTAPAEWTATLKGPLTSPRLLLDGEAVQLDGDIAAGVTAVVDSATQSVLLDNAVRPMVSYLSSWWTIPPQVQATFALRAAAGTGTGTLTWRDASY